MKRLMALLATAIIVMPPVPAQGKTIMVGVCGERDVRISIPVKPTLPMEGDGHGCCRKGCHAASERRKKADGQTDDSCC